MMMEVEENNVMIPEPPAPSAAAAAVTATADAASQEAKVAAADASLIATAPQVVAAIKAAAPRRFKKVAKKRIFTNPEALGIHIPKGALSDDEPTFEPRRTRSRTTATSQTGSSKPSSSTADEDEEAVDDSHSEGEDAISQSIASSNASSETRTNGKQTIAHALLSPQNREEPRKSFSKLMNRSGSSSSKSLKIGAASAGNEDESEDQRWQGMYERLADYVAEHSHTLVPYRYRKNVDDLGDRMALGTWVSQQRSKYRERTILERHFEKLNQFDFYWEVPRGPAFTTALIKEAVEKHEGSQSQRSNTKKVKKTALQDSKQGSSISLPSIVPKSNKSSLSSFRATPARALPLRRSKRSSPPSRFGDESSSKGESEEDEKEERDREQDTGKSCEDEPDALAPVQSSKRKRKESFKAAAASAAANTNKSITVKIKMKHGKAYRVENINEPQPKESETLEDLNQKSTHILKHSRNSQGRWELMTRRLQEYRDDKGDCRVPYRYKENLTIYGDPIALGLWVSRQRSKRREDPGKSHTREQLKELNNLGFAWDVTRPIPTPRVEVRTSSVQGADATALALAEEESWGDTLKQSMRAFVRQGSPMRQSNPASSVAGGGDGNRSTNTNGYPFGVKKNSEPPSDDETDSESEGEFGRKLSRKPKIATPNGVPASLRAEDQWNMMYTRLKQYKHEFGSCLVPRSYSGDDASKKDPYKLGRWVQTQREEYDREQETGTSTHLTPLRKRLLTKIGFVWQLSSDIEWDEHDDEEEDDDGLIFGDEDTSSEEEQGVGVGDATVSVKDAVALAEAGGSALKIARSEAKPYLSSPKGRARKTGFVNRWERMYHRLQEFKAEHGHCLVPYRYKGDEEPALGFWISKQRTAYYRKREGSKATLSLDQICRLEELGFVWNPLESREKLLAEQGAHKAQDLSRGSKDEESVLSDESGLSENPLAEDELEGSLKKPPREISDERELTDDESVVQSRSRGEPSELHCEEALARTQRREGPKEQSYAHYYPYPPPPAHHHQYYPYYGAYHPYPAASHVASHPTWLPPPPPIPTPSPVAAQALGGLTPSKNTHHVVHNIATGEEMNMRRNELTVDPNVAQTDIAEVVYYL
jgi:hypothetical protein